MRRFIVWISMLSVALSMLQTPSFVSAVSPAIAAQPASQIQPSKARVTQAASAVYSRGLTYRIGEIPASVAASGQVHTLCSNAYLYDYKPQWTYLRTVHKNNGFRVSRFSKDGLGRLWAYGHSSEAPKTNGWIRANHLCRASA